MEFNRTKNSTRTFIFGVIYKLITILGPFVTRTIIIYKLGTEYLGLSSLFTSVLSILNISELGIGTAITFFLYKSVADDDRDTVRALLGLLRKLYAGIGCVILAVGLLLMPFLNYLISGDCPSDLNVYILYIVYLLNAAASYLGFAYKGILLNVYQRGDVINIIETFAEVLKYVLQVIVLILFGNYYWFAAMLPLSTIVVTMSTQFASKHLFPDLSPKGKVSKELKKSIKSKVMFLSAHSIAATLTNSVDYIVISGTMGLTAIAIYGNYSYISSAVLSIILIAYRSLTPAIGNSLCSDSREKNQKLFNSLQFMSFWIITWCSVCLLCLFQPFIEIWVGKHCLLQMTVVVMIVMYFFSNASRQFYGTYVAAAGLWNKTLPRQIISAALNLLLDLILVKRFGIGGIVFASFATNFFVSLPLDILVTYKDVLKEGVFSGYLRFISQALLTSIICAIVFFLCIVFKFDGVVALMYRAVICVVIPNCILLCVFRKSDELIYMKIHLAGLFKR